jgi:hypothetical protein
VLLLRPPSAFSAAHNGQQQTAENNKRQVAASGNEQAGRQAFRVFGLDLSADFDVFCMVCFQVCLLRSDGYDSMSSRETYGEPAAAVLVL